MHAPSSKVLVSIVAALALFACVQTERAQRKPPPASAASDVSTAAPKAAPARPPVAHVTTPMPGEPSAGDLKEAGLFPSGCNGQDAALRARIARMRTEVDAELGRWQDERRRGPCVRPVIPFGPGNSLDAERAAESMSRTNNQVANVDEADLVKSDGRFVYIAANRALRIIEAMNPRIVSITKFPDVVRELFVEGDRAVVFTSSGEAASTRIHVLDISDRSHPKSMRQIELSGSLVASRRIGTTVHTVVVDGDDGQSDYDIWPPDLDRCDATEATLRKGLARLKIDNERKMRKGTPLPTMRDRGSPVLLCTGLYESKVDSSHTFTTVISFDMADERVSATTATFRSRPGAIFASESALYFSTVRQKPKSHWYPYHDDDEDLNETSNLHKFHIGAYPSETRYVGSGLVPGHALNQFAMDEWHGYLRIATTHGQWRNRNVENAVSVLAEAEQGGNLVRVGAVEHLARGEDIRAVRFDDERAYVVTFKRTDPLFALDLYDVAHPVILGELKIPGFSTYLHRIDDHHLLSIGFDTVARGSFALLDGLLLQLFDVTRPTEPKLLHREKVGTRRSSSNATGNHLAFNYFDEKGLLAIPMASCEASGDARPADHMSFDGLLVYRVSVDSGFTRLGAIDHGPQGSTCGASWPRGSSKVLRSLFLDDLVYSLAMDRVKVRRMSALGTDMADIALLP